MTLGHVFAPKPLLVAALIGALAFGAVAAATKRRGWGPVATGAALGVVVQVGVRALGVS